MNIKVAIGLPTNRLVRPKTAQSLLETIVKSKNNYKFIVSTRGYNTAENRNYISAQAVKSGCTHLMFTDDDMIYEHDTIEKLLAHDKDIVGGLYKTKYEEQNDLIEYLDGKKEEDKLFECVALGGGLLLVKTDVFKKVPEPWFGYKWHAGMVTESNDWYFCRKARESGFKIWCDTNVTAKHIGLYEY